MAISLYIYYRIQDNFLPTRQQAEILIAEIKRKTGANGRLLQRCDDASTWMEVYEDIPSREALQLAMQAALALAPRLAAVTRHEEWFTECEPARPNACCS